MQVSAAPAVIRYSPAAPARAGTFGYAGSEEVSGVPGVSRTWSFTAATMRLHRSQFSAATLRALGHLPGDERVVYLAPAEPVLEDDDVLVCP